MNSGQNLVRVAVAHQQPEAEMLSSLLEGAGIPVLVQRSGGFDVPDFLAAGPRDILVPADREAEARDLLGTVNRD
jgi:Putative prokaryotic signal transducing protein